MIKVKQSDVCKILNKNFYKIKTMKHRIYRYLLISVSERKRNKFNFIRTKTKIAWIHLAISPIL